MAKHTQTTGTGRRPIVGVAFAATAFILAAQLGAWGVDEDYRLGPSVLTDSFERDVPVGWGTATSGQAYATSSTQLASVAGGNGEVALTRGQSVSIVALATSAADSRAATTIQPTSLPTSGNGVSAHLLLRLADGKGYRATLRFGRDQKASLRLDRIGKPDTVLVWDRLIPTKVTSTSTALRFEFQVTGTAPVTLAARAWPVGAAAPTWQVTARDATAVRASGAGAVGVAVGLSSGTSESGVRFDDLQANALIPPAAITAPSPAPGTLPVPTVQPTDSPTAAPTPLASPSATTEPTPSNTATPSPSPTGSASPTPTVSPTATPTAVTPPAAPSPVPPPASVGTSWGSAPVGSTRYSVPSGAVFVSPRNDSSGDGSAASPYGSLAFAVAKARTGATLVLRGGEYHESVTVPFDRDLTIQPYPGEAVWLDGSSVVTGWKRDGTRWYIDGWTTEFDHRVSFTAGADESGRWLDPAYPMAGYPDQVWIDGAKLAQVGSVAAVVPGTFLVDTASDRLIVGSDPSAKEVRASTLEYALRIQGAGSTVRGIGVRNYADHLATLGVVSAQVPGISLENLVVKDNASVGVYVWARGDTFSRLTVTGNGMLGLVASKADDLTIADSVFSENNAEHFKDAPASGGAKLHSSNNVSVLRSVFAHNASGGLWFDVSMRNSRILNSTIAGNASTGLEVELSENVVVAGNYIVGNARAGLEIYDAGTINVSNNVIASNTLYAIRMLQDDRTGTDPAVPWKLRDVTVRNNAISAAPGSVSGVQVHGLNGGMRASDLGVTFDGNLYNRQTAGNPTRLIQWASGSALVSYRSLDEFRAGTGNDPHSRALEGTAAFNGDYTLSAAGVEAATGVAVPVTGAVSGSLGVPAGWTSFGPPERMRS